MNYFQTVDWVSMEAVIDLTNQLPILDCFERQWEKDYDKAFAPGEAIRVKRPQQANIRRGLAAVPQAINRIATYINVDKVVGADFSVDDVEVALKMERSKEEIYKQYVSPTVSKIAQDWESQAAYELMLHTNNFTGVLGTNPTTMAPYTAANARLTNLGCPPTDRTMVVTPNMHATLANSAATNFTPSTVQSDLFKTAILGIGAGMKWKSSVSLWQHTAGTWAGTVEVTTGGISGNQITVTCTNGDTFKANDRVSIAAVNAVNIKTLRPIGAMYLVVQEDVTAVGTSAVLTVFPSLIGPGSPYQNVDALPATGADLTLWPGTASPNGKTGVIGLAIGTQAYAYVGKPLPEPKGSVEYSKVYMDKDTQIGIRYLKQYFGMPSNYLERYDTLGGFGPLWSEYNACAVVGLD